MTSPRRIPELIRSVRGNRSLRDFGDLLGVSHTTVQRWELGEAEPNRENMADMFTHTADDVYRLSLEIFTARYREQLETIGEACRRTAPAKVA